MEYVEGETLKGPHRTQWRIAPDNAARRWHPGGRCARSGARNRSHSSRHQAGKHSDYTARAGQGGRLRSRKNRPDPNTDKVDFEARTLVESYRRRHCPGYGRLHVSRADARRNSGSPFRDFFAGLCALRGGNESAAFWWSKHAFDHARDRRRRSAGAQPGKA